MNATGTARLLVNEVPITNVRLAEALSMIGNAVREGDRRCVFFVNADCVNISARNPEYHRILGREDAWVFGDGAGIRLAGMISRQPVRDNVNGTDMFPLLVEQCARNGHTVFLLGARDGVASKVSERMVAHHPALRIVGTHHGFFPHDDCGDVIDKINASGADIVLVAFGAPLQERFIARHRAALRAPVVMGVGGLFDFYSGRIPRAPKVIRDMSLEWAWRLVLEPRRLWKRYLLGNVAFVGRVLWWEIQRSTRNGQPTWPADRRLVLLPTGERIVDRRGVVDRRGGERRGQPRVPALRVVGSPVLDRRRADRRGTAGWRSVPSVA